LNKICNVTSIIDLYLCISNLCNCELSEISGILLASIIKESKALKTLWVNKNNLSVKGTRYISEALKINENLTELQISFII